MVLHIPPQKNREDYPAGKHGFYLKWTLGKLVQSNLSQEKGCHHVVSLYSLFATCTWIPKSFIMNIMGKCVEH